MDGTAKDTRHERGKERALPSLWTERHRRIHGEAWSFRGREYLRDIHDDRARHVVVRKAAQMGFTEALQNRLVHAVDFGVDAMIVFPTDDTAKRHSKARFLTLLEGSPYIAGIFREVNAVDVKRSVDTSLYFEGSNSGDALYSVPIGLLVVDEVDRCVQDALDAAEHRLDGAEDPVAVYVSTPTVPSVGVSKLWDESDQKRWFVRCPRCEWRGPLDGDVPELERWDLVDWPGKPVIPEAADSWSVAESVALRCPGCGVAWAEAERLAAVDGGAWVAGIPGAKISGYAINQFCSPTQTPADIVYRYFRAKADINPERLRQFTNQVLGIPFVGEAEGITREMVLDLAVPARAREDYGHCLGADPGKVIHAAQGDRDETGRLTVRRCLELPGWDALHQVMRQEQILRAVVDRYPETSMSEAFCEAFPTVAFRAEHPEGMKEMYTWDVRRQVVQIREVDAVDVLLARIRRKSLLLDRRDLWELAVEHLLHIQTTMDLDRHGVPTRRVLHKIGGRDDLALAVIYLDAATSLVNFHVGDRMSGWQDAPRMAREAALVGTERDGLHPLLFVPDMDPFDEDRAAWEAF